MIKIGIIGANKLCKQHISQLQTLEEFVITGLFDQHEDNAHEICRQFNIPYISDVAQLIESSDALDILSPVGTHFRYASKAIMQSRHVLLNGLISEDIREAKQLNELAIEANVNIKILHEDKFHPELKTLKRLTKKPTYIECNRFQQKVLSISNDSLIFGMLLHDIDLLITVVGSNVRKVVANASRIFNTYIDFINVRIEFENGCITNINCGNFERSGANKILIYQKGDCISLDLETFHIKHMEKNDHGTLEEVPVSQSKTKSGDIIRNELQHFAQTILNRQRITHDTYQSFQSLRIAHQIIEKLHPTTLFDA